MQTETSPPPSLPPSPAGKRAKFLPKLRFILVVGVVTVAGVYLLINVHAISPDVADTSPTPSTPPVTVSSDASGEAMPLGDIAGWHQVFQDDFSGSKLDQSKWNAYVGPAGGDPDTYWDPSHAVVKKGMLELESYRDPHDDNKWVSAGVSSDSGLHQSYGKYLVRFRMDAGKGITGILLLWPADNKWPPEIDFAEDGAGDRTQMTANFYYGPNNQSITHTVTGDFTQWHTMGVEWRPGTLIYTLDSKAWATVNSPYVPTTPMSLDMQTQAGICGNTTNPCPDATTPAQVNMQIDWVVAYAPK